MSRSVVNCRVCNGSFWGMTGAKYCSPDCRRSSKGVSTRVLFPGASTADVGAGVELIVAAHLLLNGWSVFRSLSPACYCDIIAVRGGVVRHLECRTGKRSADGVVAFPQEARKGATEFAVYCPADGALEFVVIRDAQAARL